MNDATETFIWSMQIRFATEWFLKMVILSYISRC